MNTRLSRRQIQALTVAFVAASIVAGCNMPPADGSSPAPTATTVPTDQSNGAPSADTVDFSTGSLVTDQATIDACQPIGVGIIDYGELSDGACPLPTGSRLFPMADGSHVVVNQDDPLPEAVAAQVAATAQSSGASNSVTGTVNMALADFIKNAPKLTGKSVVVIYSVTGANNITKFAAGKAYNEVYMSVDGTTHATADEAYQAGLAFVAGQAHPDRWMVIPYAG